MLDESEWATVLPLLVRGIRDMQEYRHPNSTGALAAKMRIYGDGALQRYFELTGIQETNVNSLWHHRLSLYGPPCSCCGKLLRTPRAKFCAACGKPVSA
jgi:rRNA maturation endonuclease Nob1